MEQSLPLVGALSWVHSDPEHGGRRHERYLGRVADTVGTGVVVKNGAIAAGHCFGEPSQGGGYIAARVRATERLLTTRSPGENAVHAVLGEGARLVGADHTGGPQRLYSAQSLYQRPPSGEFTHANCQRQGDGG